MNRIKNLFGEPAVITSVIGAAISLAITFGLAMSNEQVAVTMAAVTAALGLVTALMTRRSVLSALLGLSKAVLALAVGFGLTLTADQTGAVIAFITLALGLFNRASNSPIPLPGQPGNDGEDIGDNELQSIFFALGALAFLVFIANVAYVRFSG